MSQEDKLSQFQMLIELIVNKVPSIHSPSNYNHDYYTSTNLEGSKTEEVNLATGTYKVTTSNNVTKKGKTLLAGGALNSNPNKTFVGFGISKAPLDYETMSSHIELTFSESSASIKQGLNLEAMDHIYLYVIFETTNCGGKCVEVIKQDWQDVTESLKDLSWRDVINTFKKHETYPLGIINEQTLHDKQQLSTNISPGRLRRLELLNKANLIKDSNMLNVA